MENYEIKISGSGKKEEIVNSLKEMIKSISAIKGEDNVTLEDSTLICEITEISKP